MPRRGQRVAAANVSVVASARRGWRDGRWAGLSKTGYRPMDSRANLVAWKARLGAGEVARIRALTGDVAGRWYPAADLDERV